MVDALKVLFGLRTKTIRIIMKSGASFEIRCIDFNCKFDQKENIFTSIEAVKGDRFFVCLIKDIDAIVEVK